MRTILTTLIVLAALAGTAHAATIGVRIEGQSRTLFEGPVSTTGRNVQSLSERATGAIRRCDGTNNSGSTQIVPTGTAATADALSILGQGFDGDWYDEYEDYLISRLGDEAGNWRLFKGLAFSGVGGCQLKLADGEGVLWANQSGAPLALTLNGSTATTTAGAEIYEATADGAVAQSFGVPAGGTLDLSVLPGGRWYRIKARMAARVRSPRIDWCSSACPAKPADMQTRVPPPPVFYGPGGRVIPNSPEVARTVTALRVSRPVAGRSAYRRGRIAVRWRVLEQGVGLLRWTISSDDLTTKAKRYVTRARATTGTSALLRLPAGRAHALRFTATDRLQRDHTSAVGRVLVPIDDRSKAVRRSGPWRKARSSKAWLGTLLRGRRGARLKVRLAAGRPALVLRGKRTAVVRIGSKRLRVRGGRTALGAKRRKAGSVTITVVRGSIDLDGVAASP